jgi:putative SOS response-associated peptidase YedK
MPVILTTEEEREAWMTALPQQALALQTAEALLEILATDESLWTEQERCAIETADQHGAAQALDVPFR